MTISLIKEAATVSLVKHLQQSLDQGNDPGEIQVQCEAYIDTSTSMSGRYSVDEVRRRVQPKRKLFGHREPAPAAPAVASEMQTTVTRDLALTLTGLDADGQIPLYAFDRAIHEIGTATEQNYTTILSDWLADNDLYPATRFMPIIAQVAAGEPTDPANADPRVIIVHTDGTPSDEAAFRQAIIDRSGKPEFWIIIGHGHSLSFVRELDNMTDANGNDPRVVDNVALVEVENAAHLSDGEYFDKVVKELITQWFPAIRAKKITNR